MMSPASLQRRLLAALRRFTLIATVLCLAGRVTADDVAVPISLQIDLLLKVASYDKNLQQRAHGRVRVGVVVKLNDADSARSAAQAMKSLSAVESLEGLPLDAAIEIYADAPGLARYVGEHGISILYFTPGFSESEMDAMARALDGVSVLSAGALAKYTIRGMVLGFDLAGGKPKLLVHLARARRQQVELSSSVLKLMRVIE
jgi:uncharacterized protein DUF4154